MGKPFTRKQIIGHLEKLSNRWNSKYWLFAAETLHLMSKSRDGRRMVTPDGGVSPKASITTFSGIEYDGGEIKQLTCKRCGWTFKPRIDDVVQCPHCKSARWKQPKEVK